MNNKHYQVFLFLMFRNNPRKSNYGWNKFRAEDLHRIYVSILEKNS